MNSVLLIIVIFKLNLIRLLWVHKNVSVHGNLKYTYTSLGFAQTGDNLSAIEATCIRVQCENDGAGRMFRVRIWMSRAIRWRFSVGEWSYLLDGCLVKASAQSVKVYTDHRTLAYTPGAPSSVGSMS